jgi:alkylation response protein AidB-like acyl-CoA dehydrogenase
MTEQSVTEFRHRARSWLEANAPGRPEAGTADGEARAVDVGAQQAFQAKLCDAGFAGITWPEEYGGQGLTNAEQIAFSEEARNFTLPVSAFVIGLGMPGPRSRRSDTCPSSCAARRSGASCSPSRAADPMSPA